MAGGWQVDKVTTISHSDVHQIFAARMPRAIREREILRVAAGLGGDGGERGAAKARKEVLKWVQKRVGDRLPETAWKYGEFEKHMGGRDCKAVHITDGPTDLWAIRSNDPDKNVAQRIWTTEVVIGFAGTQNALFSLRLFASSPETDLRSVERAVPGLLRQLVNRCGLYQGTRRLTPEPWLVKSDGDIEDLIDALLDQSRREPIFVLTIPTNAVDPIAPLIDPKPLSRAMLGLARVVVLPAHFTWALTERVGKRLSVFGGAIRTYLPGFTEDADPYDHALFLGERLSSSTNVRQVSVTLRQIAAAESLRKLRLGSDVLSFSTVQAHSLVAIARLNRESTTTKKRLIAEIKNMEESLKKSENELEWFAEQHDRAEKTAKELEKKLNVAELRIQHLIAQLATHDDKPDSNIPLPDTWVNFSDWCEIYLKGRVLLSPRARREVSAPLFEDVAIAGRCLLWLANDYHQGRLKGNAGSLRGPIEGGLKNDRCGADQFRFGWQEKQINVEWHIKNGGNTRDPSRCLRIYYFWDEASQQVVIASMPAHIRTGAT